MQKISIFWSKIVPKQYYFTQSNSMRAALEVFQFYFQFLQDKRFVLIKCKFYRPCVWCPASRLLQIGHKSKNWQWHHSLPTRCHCQFFYVAIFLLLSLVIAPSFMSISLLVLEIWSFSFIRDWPEIRISEISIWVFSNIWRMGWVRDTKFGKCCKMPELHLLPFLSY